MFQKNKTAVRAPISRLEVVNIRCRNLQVCDTEWEASGIAAIRRGLNLQQAMGNSACHSRAPNVYEGEICFQRDSVYENRKQSLG